MINDVNAAVEREHEQAVKRHEKLHSELYMKAYMDGYTAAMEKAKAARAKPYVDKESLIERYDGKIGVNKALEILRNVRHVCNGGSLHHDSLVLLSELEYWEGLVDKQYKERL